MALCALDNLHLYKQIMFQVYRNYFLQIILILTCSSNVGSCSNVESKSQNI